MPALLSYAAGAKITTPNRLGRETFAIGIIGLLLFTANIWQQPFINFESRFALFAQEMLRHGLSFFPTTYAQPYPDYPATSTVLIYFLSLPFGAVTKFSAVLPTAIAGAITLALSYRLLTPLSRHWALLTVCMELLTATFVAEARSLSLDQMIATITIASFFCAYSADSEHAPRRRKWLPLLFFIGFAIRGPLGLVVPVGVVCSYYALSQQWRALLTIGVIAAIILVLSWGALLGLARWEGGDTFMRDVIRMQVSGRIDAQSDVGPFYYFTSSFGNYALAFPFAFLALSGATTAWRQRRHQPTAALFLFFLGWTALVLIGLSIPHTKKIRYLLPMMPALAAIAAYPFIAANDRLSIWLRRGVHGILLLLPTLVSAGLFAAKKYAAQHDLTLPLSILALQILLLLIQIIVIGIALKVRASTQRVSVAAIGAVATLWLLQVLVVEPAQLQLNDTRQFTRAVEQLRQKTPAPLAFFAVGKDAAAIKYLVNVDYDVQPNFYSSADDIAQAQPPFYLVLDKNKVAALHNAAIAAATPLFEGRFDRDHFVVYYVTGR